MMMDGVEKVMMVDGVEKMMNEPSSDSNVHERYFSGTSQLEMVT